MLASWVLPLICSIPSCVTLCAAGRTNVMRPSPCCCHSARIAASIQAALASTCAKLTMLVSALLPLMVTLAGTVARFCMPAEQALCQAPSAAHRAGTANALHGTLLPASLTGSALSSTSPAPVVALDVHVLARREGLAPHRQASGTLREIYAHDQACAPPSRRTSRPERLCRPLLPARLTSPSTVCSPE